jgi:hypothetical protein
VKDFKAPCQASDDPKRKSYSQLFPNLCRSLRHSRPLPHHLDDVLTPSAPPRRTTDPVTSSRPCRSAGWASTVTLHIDTSDQVYFGNDQIGVRFLEEIDFDYLATDATAVLLTAVS